MISRDSLMMIGLNDQEIPAFVELTKEMDITVRFIEYMPFEGKSSSFLLSSFPPLSYLTFFPSTTDNKWSTQKLIPSGDLLETITKLHPNIIKLENHISDTTRSWKIPGYKGKIGFISSMSDHFCAGCTRLRIGADGGVKVRSSFLPSFLPFPSLFSLQVPRNILTVSI